LIDAEFAAESGQPFDVPDIVAADRAVHDDERFAAQFPRILAQANNVACDGSKIGLGPELRTIF